MSDNKRIYLSPPHMSGYELGFVTEAFESNWLSSVGPHVDTFEKELADKVGAGGAVALSSGTAAIHIVMRLLGIGTGDKVFCSSLTFIGSVGPVIYQGAEPVFIDSEPASWNISPAALERAFVDAEKSGSLPRAVIVVNIYGQSADMDPLKEICDRYSVPLVEDAAESLGALYKNRASGTFGRFGIFSFNGNKIITTSGGGMLVSEDIDALEKARFLSTQARDPARHYQHSEVGYNYRMSNVLAGIGRGQLRVLDDRIRARRAVFARYYEALSGIEGLAFMPEASFGTATRWLTIMTVNPSVCSVTPVGIMDALAAEDIEARPVWKPMHLQPIFLKCVYYPHYEEMSICDGFFEQGVCLPSGSGMTAEDQDRVIDVILKCIKKR
jgi:pyridoxal phosphate-dependent aminotransferase EpsN